MEDSSIRQFDFPRILCSPAGHRYSIRGWFCGPTDQWGCWDSSSLLASPCVCPGFLGPRATPAWPLLADPGIQFAILLSVPVQTPRRFGW